MDYWPVFLPVLTGGLGLWVGFFSVRRARYALLSVAIFATIAAWGIVEVMGRAAPGFDGIAYALYLIFGIVPAIAGLISGALAGAVLRGMQHRQAGGQRAGDGQD